MGISSAPYFFLKIQSTILETITNCPVCGEKTFKAFLVCKDYLVSSQEFSIQQCDTCDFRLTNPRPDGESIGAYYKSDQYISHNDTSRGLINTVYRIVRTYTLQSKLKLINRLSVKKGNLLDVGCGTGAFLETCQKGGWRVTGMEPDQDARSLAVNKLKADISPSLDQIDKQEKFDIITLWHVLEHIPDLNETIPVLNSLLDSTGTLIVAVPNSDSYDAQYFQQFWAAYDVPRHLHHFTPLSIERLFKKHGFKKIGQLPMPFDAFYIAMLSTRYKTGKTDYLKSIQVGLKSNALAKQTKNTSSQIYLFKKA